MKRDCAPKSADIVALTLVVQQLTEALQMLGVRVKHLEKGRKRVSS